MYDSDDFLLYIEINVVYVHGETTGNGIVRTEMYRDMIKEFNITGSCNPEWHYMVDTAKRFKAVEDLIEKGKYFTINRARQYGKTTMLQMIRRKLSDRYLVIPLSFEGMDDGAFASHETFVEIFSKMMSRILN